MKLSFENKNSRKFIIIRSIVAITVLPTLLLFLTAFIMYTIVTITTLPIIGITFAAISTSILYLLIWFIKNLTSPIKGTSHRLTKDVHQYNKQLEQNFIRITDKILNKLPE